MILRYAYLADLRLRLSGFVTTLAERVISSIVRCWPRFAAMSTATSAAITASRRCDSAADFRRRQPIAIYEEHHPYIERVLHGDVNALFAPGTRVLMFAMTSGTTGQPNGCRSPPSCSANTGRLADVGSRRLRRSCRSDEQANAAAHQRLAAISRTQRRALRADQRSGGDDAAVVLAA